MARSGAGYSLIATTDHITSMLDLDDEAARELVEFTSAVRGRLRPLYGNALVTEHGRVAACVAAATQRYEPHCLHAHRLVFPGAEQLDLGAEVHGCEVFRFASFAAAHDGFQWPGQYLYAEADDGSCQVAVAPSRVPRQFFRRVVAGHRDEPELADWRRHPGLDLVEAALRDLGP